MEALTRPLVGVMYLRNVVFTTGLSEKADRYIVASGEADLACRITHVPRRALFMSRAIWRSILTKVGLCGVCAARANGLRLEQELNKPSR